MSKGILILTIIFLLLIFGMQPLFNKAYNDDFAYAQSVKHLVFDHTLKVSDWAAVSLIAQIFWGALFSSLFGFSFITLQLSVIVLFYLAVVSFYAILRELELDSFTSVIFSLALLSF